jgi:V/A-type H+-transporting ATPase subunit I
MIEPMKKLSLLLYYQDQERFTTALQELGVLHVEEKAGIDVPELSQKLEQVKACARVASELARLHGPSHRAALPQEEKRDALQIVEEYTALQHEIDEVHQHRLSLAREIAHLEPWGEFEPQVVTKLGEFGVRVRFYECGIKHYAQLDLQGVASSHISTTAGRVHFVVVDEEGDETPPIDAEQIPLPALSLSGARAQLAQLQRSEVELRTMLSGFSTLAPYMEEQCNRLSAEAQYQTVSHSFSPEAAGRVVQLSGWVPVSLQGRVEALLQNYPAWYGFSDPTKDDAVPIKLRNRKASKLFVPVLKIYTLPDYFEMDPTPFFAPFFAFFFGLCLGDVGYGLLLSAVALGIVLKGPAKLRGFGYLGIILGVSTTLAGVLLNSFFGALIFATGNESGLMAKGGALALLQPVKGPNGTYFPAMPFAMYVGLSQIVFATVLNIINRWRYDGLVYALMPAGSLLLIGAALISVVKIDFMNMGVFQVGAVALGPAVASIPWVVVQGLLGSGLVLTFLFNNPQKNISVRLGLGLWELYLFASSLMGDSLSYLRLFALGLAGGLLGAAFNQIAFMLIQGENGLDFGTPLVVATILILVVGHALNFALSCLGSFVHPLRLTFVEFFGNLDFKGGGKAYRPFAKSEHGV